jgi:hypothetical protein
MPGDINWSKEFVKFIKNKQELPEYRGIKYNCLITNEKVLNEFHERKKKYEQQIKEQKHHHRQEQQPVYPMSKRSHTRRSAIKRSASNKDQGTFWKRPFGGRKTTRRRVYKNKYRGGGWQNVYNNAFGYKTLPSSSPYQDQLQSKINTHVKH